MEGKFLNILKVIFEKPRANTIINGGKLERFSSQI
jgi:hypothetical protein